MDNISVRDEDELRRIMNDCGLSVERERPWVFVFSNARFVEVQGARVRQDGDGFCVTHTLVNGWWHPTTVGMGTMGEHEFLFYLEHLLPFAKAANLVQDDAVNYLWNMWVMAACVPGMQWTVHQAGRYAGDCGWFDMEVPGGASLSFSCVAPGLRSRFALRVHSAAPMRAVSGDELHDLFHERFTVTSAELTRPTSPMQVTAVALLERAVAALVYKTNAWDL